MTEIHRAADCADPTCPRCLYAIRTVEVFDLTAQVETLRDTLARRSEALNRTGADNDRLRATIARVEKFPGLWLAETSDGQGHQLDHWRGPDYVDGRDVAFEMCAEALHAALADQEPARD